MKQPRFEVYKAGDGWRWRLVAKNRKIVADSAEAYASKRNAGCEAARAIGAEILACDEMRAIKAVLLSLASLNTAGAARIDVLRLAGLPDLVIDWVFS